MRTVEAYLADIRTRARRLAGLDGGDAGNGVPWRAILASLVAVGLLTTLLQTLAGDLALIDSALLYLMLVFGIAVFFGSTPAVIAAIVAFLGLNIGSIPPTGSLSIDSWQHLVALLVYLGIAVATGRLVAHEANRSRMFERERERAGLLAQSDELKTALLAAVSHELRSPLAAIKTSSSALLDARMSWDDESRRELLEAIDQEADRLDAVVGNLLDLSRIEGGALRPNKEWCDVEELVLDVAQRLRKRSASHPISVELPAELPLVFLDYVEIAQVLVNLGDNAIKYTPPGTPVQIAAWIEGDSLKLSTHDDGPGIPPEEREHLFDRFWRADRPGQSAGAGIGLTISRGLVEAHAGTITVTSSPESGTTFTVSLPISGAGDAVP
jgi:K+-sensing histidine kinase KdpD